MLTIIRLKQNNSNRANKNVIYRSYIHAYFMLDPRDLQKHRKIVVSHTEHDDVRHLHFYLSFNKWIFSLIIVNIWTETRSF